MNGKERADFIRALALASHLWKALLEGIEEGALDAPNSLEEAFKKGVLAAMACIDSEPSLN